MALNNPSLNSSEAGARFLDVCVCVCVIDRFLHSRVFMLRFCEMKRAIYQDFDTSDSLIQEDLA